MSFDPELQSFKKLNLREYAAAEGFVVDRRHSSQASIVMRRAADKIVIKRERDGHYVYCSVHDRLDQGTIIDFVMHRQNLTIGGVRQKLRAWHSGGHGAPAGQALAPSAKDRALVRKMYGETLQIGQQSYIQDARKIPWTVISSRRFSQRIRTDVRGNVMFPHYDVDGLCGFEIKNRSFTGFAKGGEKGLWHSQMSPQDQQLVLTESAIDALSFAALFPDFVTRFASFGGAISTSQLTLVKVAIERLPVGAHVVAATDNDLAGDHYASMIEDIVERLGRCDLVYRRQVPPLCKDWNDVLCGIKLVQETSA